MTDARMVRARTARSALKQMTRGGAPGPMAGLGALNEREDEMTPQDQEIARLRAALEAVLAAMRENRVTHPLQVPPSPMEQKALDERDRYLTEIRCLRGWLENIASGQVWSAAEAAKYALAQSPTQADFDCVKHAAELQRAREELEVEKALADRLADVCSAALDQAQIPPIARTLRSTLEEHAKRRGGR